MDIIKKYKSLKFMPLNKGLTQFFNWINEVPNKKNLYNYHPLILKKHRIQNSTEEYDIDTMAVFEIAEYLHKKIN